MLGEFGAIVVGFVMGWFAHEIYSEIKARRRDNWRPLNRRGERLAIFK